MHMILKVDECAWRYRDWNDCCVHSQSGVREWIYVGFPWAIGSVSLDFVLCPGGWHLGKVWKRRRSRIRSANMKNMPPIVHQANFDILNHFDEANKKGVCNGVGGCETARQSLGYRQNSNSISNNTSPSISWITASRKTTMALICATETRLLRIKCYRWQPVPLHR